MLGCLQSNQAGRGQGWETSAGGLFGQEKPELGGFAWLMCDAQREMIEGWHGFAQTDARGFPSHCQETPASMEVGHMSSEWSVMVSALSMRGVRA